MVRRRDHRIVATPAPGAPAAPLRHPGRLTVYLCDAATIEHHRLCDVIVQRAKAAGLRGATVLRGIEGFGRSGDIHTTRLLDVSDHLPTAVIIVDDEERLRDFAHRNDDCFHGRLVTLESLEVVEDAG
jgi:PII-like signaling protein